MDRVARKFGKWKLGSSRVDDRSFVGSHGRDRGFETLTGMGSFGFECSSLSLKLVFVSLANS